MDLLDSDIMKVVLAIATILGGFAAIKSFLSRDDNELNSKSLVTDNKDIFIPKGGQGPENKTVLDLKTGLIETFQKILLINGENIPLNEVKSLKTKSVKEEIQYSNIFIYILSSISGAFDKLLEDRGIGPLYLFVLLMLLYVSAVGLNISTDFLIVNYVIKAFSGIYFVAFIFFAVIYFFVIFIQVIIDLMYRYDEKYFEVNYIELKCVRGVYRIWVNHKDKSKRKIGGQYRDKFIEFNEVFNLLKAAIFEEDGKKYKISIYENYFIMGRGTERTHVIVQEKV